jgi:hypothetical protein
MGARHQAHYYLPHRHTPGSLRWLKELTSVIARQQWFLVILAQQRWWP